MLGRPFTVGRSLRQIIDLADRPERSGETWCRGSAHAALSVTLGRIGEEQVVRVEVGLEAAGLIRRHGGRRWVWAGPSPICCGGTPAYMHAAAGQSPGLSWFNPRVPREASIWFRHPAGRFPDLLEIGVRGRRRPCVKAPWDLCLIML
jgi:hypothetical protein